MTPVLAAVARSARGSCAASGIAARSKTPSLTAASRAEVSRRTHVVARVQPPEPETVGRERGALARAFVQDALSLGVGQRSPVRECESEPARHLAPEQLRERSRYRRDGPHYPGA